MKLSEALEGIFINSFASKSLLKQNKIYSFDIKYENLDYNYKLGIHLTILEVSDCFYKIDNYINSLPKLDKKEQVENAMFFVKKAHINQTHIIKNCNFSRSFQTCRFVKISEVEIYLYKIRREIAIILNRLIEYVID